MTPTPPHIDPVSAAVALLTAFVSPAIANVMGVYSVIFIGAAFGSGWALMRREKGSLFSAICFVLLMTGTATFTTVGLSQLLNKYIELSDSNLLLGPVALLIGAVGHDWPRVVPVLFNFILDFAMKFRTGSGYTPPQPAPDSETEEHYAGGDR
jgi:hypothetical protein